MYMLHFLGCLLSFPPLKYCFYTCRNLYLSVDPEENTSAGRSRPAFIASPPTCCFAEGNAGEWKFIQTVLLLGLTRFMPRIGADQWVWEICCAGGTPSWFFMMHRSCCVFLCFYTCTWTSTETSKTHIYLLLCGMRSKHGCFAWRSSCSLYCVLGALESVLLLMLTNGYYLGAFAALSPKTAFGC